MDMGNLSSISVTIGGGFFGGILIGYAMKKVVKVVAVVLGLFFAGLAYLQYQQIVSINWDKIQAASQNTLSTLVNATTQIPGFNNGDHTAALALSNFGIPLTASMSMGCGLLFLPLVLRY